MMTIDFSMVQPIVSDRNGIERFVYHFGIVEAGVYHKMQSEKLRKGCRTTCYILEIFVFKARQSYE